MLRWWLNVVRRFLQISLSWVESQQSPHESARQEKTSFLERQVHVPTPLVALGAAGILFFMLVPEVGFFPQKILALFGLLALIVAFFILYFRFDLPQYVHDDEAVFLTGLGIILGVFIIEIWQICQTFFPKVFLGMTIGPKAAFAVPIGGVAILITLLLNMRLALLISMVLALVVGMLNQFSFDAMFVAFFSSAAAMLAAQRIRNRGDILRAGFHVIWVTMLAVYGLGLLYGWQWKEVIFYLVLAMINGCGCAAIPLLLLAVFESLFSRTTNITLLEVGDFNRPLLRRLMMEAPGTYHHTLLVAALAEQAAEAIGANSLLCRVGMYYHDIGKLVHPEYFIENQTMRRSPKDKAEHHDKLNPSISSLVIISHVKEGIALARANNVPEDIVRFIPEHHGTSLIKYFYMRALEQDEEQLPPDEVYRYPGPKPHSRETVIGMLADSVEAASRALEEPTYERLRDLVEKIVNSKFMDGQFDNAPVTLADLRKIINSFVNSLSAVYHVRIEYPEFPKIEAVGKLPPLKNP